jgi:hypothetical protein
VAWPNQQQIALVLGKTHDGWIGVYCYTLVSLCSWTLLHSAGQRDMESSARKSQISRFHTTTSNADDGIRKWLALIYLWVYGLI